MTPFVIAQADATGLPGPQLLPSMWQTTGALLVVLALLGAVVWLLRRGVMAHRKSGALAVETALPLGERRSLAIVTVEGRRLLIGLAPGQVSLVTELQPPSFEQSLSRATGEAERT